MENKLTKRLMNEMGMLICDICGGKLIVRSGGVATCEVCGMEHDEERMKEKVKVTRNLTKKSASSETISSEEFVIHANQNKVNNYLEMAESAFDGENYTDAELYCNKAIEIDSSKFKAWFIKGKAIAWQSTISSPRLKEGAALLVKAISHSGNAEKKYILDEGTASIFSVFCILLQLKALDACSNAHSKETADELINFIENQYDDICDVFEQANIDVDMSEYLYIASLLVCKAVIDTYSQTVIVEYKGNGEKEFYPQEKDFLLYVKRTLWCIYLLEATAEMCKETGYEKNQIDIYNNIIDLYGNILESCWYETNGKFSISKNGLPRDRKKAIVEEISKYKKKIDRIEYSVAKKKKAEDEARTVEYWNEHPEEKRALEAEKEALETQIESLLNKINTLSGNEEKVQLQNHIMCLIIEQRSLSIFEVKRRSYLQSKIDTAYLELNRIKEKIKPERERIEAEIEPLNKRMQEINYELIRNR